MADTWPNYPLRPLRGSEQIPLLNGDYATELTTTVQDPSTGQWMNVPTLWMTQGGAVPVNDFDQALQIALGYERGADKRFRRYGTLDSALQHAEHRTAAGGVGSGPLASASRRGY